MSRLRQVRAPAPRVVVAGGGVGALESVLALRAMTGDRTVIELVAPEPRFVYRAMAVAEPFGYAPALTIPLDSVTSTHAIRHHRGSVAGVDAAERQVTLADGSTLPYDALIIAVGAEQQTWLPGGLTFGGPDAVQDIRTLLERLRSGDADAVLFATPPGAQWTLPVYELALLTATWCAENGVRGVRLAIATSEEEPLEMMGTGAGRAVRELLADRGIALRTCAQVERFTDGTARLSTGARLDADAVVTLPILRGRPPEGLPADADGFVPCDESGQVHGMNGVYVVGDASDHPIKQGGLATQQADAAAAAIAHGLGAAVEPAAFEPVMRGLLMTGVAAAYLRSGADEAVSFEALWWPPTKVAGRYLGPFLADLHEVGALPELRERPLPDDAARAAADRRELRRLAEAMADADARWGDLRSALRWLQAVEWLDGALPAELARRRAHWRAELGQPV